MISPTREQVAIALFTLLKTVPGFKTWSRRPALWDNSMDMPALYMGNPGEDYTYQHGTATPAHVTLEFDIFIYIKDGQDPNVTPDTQLNILLDALETTLGGVAINGMPQTIGNIVHHVWIEGPIHRAPGYLNGQGLALLTIKALVPS